MIVHGTDSAHGAAHLNDIVSKLEDGLFTSTYNRKDRLSGQGGLFGPPQRPPRFSPADLDTQTLVHIASEAETLFIELRAELAMHFGPAFREKDHKASVKRLAAAGSISIVGNRTLESNSVLRITPRQAPSA